MGAAEFASNVTGRRALVLFKNAITAFATSKVMTVTDAAQLTAFQVMGVITLAVGDYVSLYALQASGGSATWFSAVKVAPGH